MFACMFYVCVFVLFHVCVLFHVYVIASCLCVVAFCVLMTLYELGFLCLQVLCLLSLMCVYLCLKPTSLLTVVMFAFVFACVCA
jgi:hypothetical protein